MSQLFHGRARYHHLCQLHSRNIHLLRPHHESHSRSRLRGRKLNSSPRCLGFQLTAKWWRRMKVEFQDWNRSRPNKKVILSNSNDSNYAEAWILLAVTFSYDVAFSLDVADLSRMTFVSRLVIVTIVLRILHNDYNDHANKMIASVFSSADS